MYTILQYYTISYYLLYYILDLQNNYIILYYKTYTEIYRVATAMILPMHVFVVEVLIFAARSQRDDDL